MVSERTNISIVYIKLTIICVIMCACVFTFRAGVLSIRYVCIRSDIILPYGIRLVKFIIIISTYLSIVLCICIFSALFVLPRYNLYVSYA